MEWSKVFVGLSAGLIKPRKCFVSERKGIKRKGFTKHGFEYGCRFSGYWHHYELGKIYFQEQSFKNNKLWYDLRLIYARR